MKKIELEITDLLWARVNAIAEKQGFAAISDALKIECLLIDAVSENEKILKMMEDIENGI